MKNITLTAALALVPLLTCQAQKPRTFSILGDSYSTYEGYVQPDTNLVWYKAQYDDQRTTDVRNVDQTWWRLLTKHTGLRLLVNNSYSGATIAYHGYNDEDYSARSFLARMDYLDKPDILIIFGGTNDSWAGTQVGEYQYDNFTREDLWTFRPAVAKMLAHLKQALPKTRLLVVINSELRPDIAESLQSIADHYGVEWLELQCIDKINGHPSITGHEKIAKAIADKIKE